MSTESQLPVEASDDGTRIVVSPDRGTRLMATGGFVIGLAVGVLLIVNSQGLPMIFAGIAAIITGTYLLVMQAQKFEFDAASARRHSPLRSTTVEWSNISEATVTKHYARTPVGGSARRIGGLTLSTGGSRRNNAVRREQPFTVVRLHHQAVGPDLTLELNQSDIAQGEALVSALRDRGWLADDVPVTVDAGR